MAFPEVSRCLLGAANRARLPASLCRNRFPHGAIITPVQAIIGMLMRTNSCCYAGHGIRIENVGRCALQVTVKVSFKAVPAS
jgi:hypothetical protein